MSGSHGSDMHDTSNPLHRIADVASRTQPTPQPPLPPPPAATYYDYGGASDQPATSGAPEPNAAAAPQTPAPNPAAALIGIQTPPTAGNASSNGTPAGNDSTASRGTLKRPRRVQNVSCDQCHYRKVKCDRKEIIDAEFARRHNVNGPPSPGSTLDDKLREMYHQRTIEGISCSGCAKHGNECKYTPKKRAASRSGKRLKVLGQVAAEHVQKGDADTSASSAVDYTNDPAAAVAANAFWHDPTWVQQGTDGGVSGIDPSLESSLGGSGSYGQASGANGAGTTSTTASSTDLLGVPGLTRVLLDSCCKAYFDWCNPFEPIVKPDEFVVRYLTYFSPHTDVARILARFAQAPVADAQGTSAGAAQAKDAQSAEEAQDRISGTIADLPSGQPLSELLILAVGANGAALLEGSETGASAAANGNSNGAAQQAEADVQIKFVLQDLFVKRFLEALEEVPLDKRLRREGLDVIDALYLMSNTSARAQLKVADSLTLSPLSSEGLIRKAMSIGLHRRAIVETDAQGRKTWRSQHDGTQFSERDVFRRSGTFWSLWVRDVFSSWSAQELPTLRQEAYSQNLPTWRARRSGEFFASFGYLDSLKELQQAGIPPPKYERFDALWLEMLLRLGFLAHHAALRLVSAEAKDSGCPVKDVERLLASLEYWRTRLSSDLTWEKTVAGYTDRAALRADSTAFRRALKAHQLEIFYHGILNVLKYTVDKFGLAVDGSEHEPLGPHEREEIKQHVRRAVDAAWLATAKRVAFLAQEGGPRLGVMRGCTVATGQTIRALAQALITIAADEQQSAHYRSIDARFTPEHTLGLAAQLVEALAWYDTDLGLAASAQQLREAHDTAARSIGVATMLGSADVPAPLAAGADAWSLLGISANAAANNNGGAGAAGNPLMQVAGLQALSSQLRDDETTRADWLGSFLREVSQAHAADASNGSAASGDSPTAGFSAQHALFSSASSNASPAAALDADKGAQDWADAVWATGGGK